MAPEPAVGRQNLPIPDAHQPYPGLVTYDAKDPATSFAPTEELRPPAGAPNVLVVLLDDGGFAASSAFGGPGDTPVAERLAANGLKYTRFHTTALCAPTRQALLTGRNHHAVGMGCITELATSAPGYTGIRPNTAAPLAEILKLNGYSTSQFGKCHEVPVHQSSPMGPFDAWPTGGGGFEYFYGFISGETNQYYPAIFEGTTPLEPPKSPEAGYHFTEDMTDKAIAWVRQQKSLMPDRPFFTYFAPGATHAPHHVPKDWIDRYPAASMRAGTRCGRNLRPPEGTRRHPGRRRAHRATRGDPGVGRHGRRAQADPRAPDGGVHGVPRAHRPPRRGSSTNRPNGQPRRHARLLHHRRQRRVRRRRDQRYVQRDVAFNGAAALGPPSSWRRRSTSSVGRRRTTTSRSAGRTQWTRPTSGQGRSRRIGAAHATARSCTGQMGSPTTGSAVTVLSRHRRRLDGPRSRGPAGAVVRARRSADASSRDEHDLLLRRCRGSGAPRPPVLRDVRQPRHLPSGMDRGHPSQHALGDEPPPSIVDDVWELYGPDDWTQAHNIAADNPAKLAEPSVSSSSRRPSTTCCRSTTAASNASTPTSRDALC